MSEREPDLSVYRRAAHGLVSPAGARAAGFVDGFMGAPPNADVWRRGHQLDSYEEGWLAGAERCSEVRPSGSKGSEHGE